MLDKEEKCNIIESSSLYFMNIFPFVQWPKKKFYNNILPKLKRRLKNKNYSINQESHNTTNFNNQEQPIVTETKVKKSNHKDAMPVSELQNTSCGAELIELFRHQFFKEKTKQLSLEEMVIISLKLGYVHVNNQPVESQTIANLLGMETEYVNSITKNVLSVFRDELVNLLDHGSIINIIANSQEENPTCKTSNNKQLTMQFESSMQGSKPSE